MTKAMLLAAGMMLAAGPVLAQTTPHDNATVEGGSTTPGNGAGAPSVATPQGQLATTPGGINPAPSVPALSGAPKAQAMSPTADSSTTGRTPKQ